MLFILVFVNIHSTYKKILKSFQSVTDDIRERRTTQNRNMSIQLKFIIIIKRKSIPQHNNLKKLLEYSPRHPPLHFSCKENKVWPVPILRLKLMVLHYCRMQSFVANLSWRYHIRRKRENSFFILRTHNATRKLMHFYGQTKIAHGRVFFFNTYF